MIEVRKGLLDALDALGPQVKSVVLIGAQAVYIHTTGFDSPVAEATKDADLAFRKELLNKTPKLEVILGESGYEPHPNGQPGSWISSSDFPVDFMLPEKLSHRKGRGAGVPPHAQNTARSARGIEGCVIDNQVKQISSLNPQDTRSYEIAVAGPSALLVAKSIKIQERLNEKRRIENKDAYDVYRLLSVVPTEIFQKGFTLLRKNKLSSEVTLESLEVLKGLFASGPSATGSMMAGATEIGIGNPETVSQSVAILAQDLLNALQ